MNLRVCLCVASVCLESFSPSATCSQVYLLQKASRRQHPQEQSLKRVRRTSSRRSAYAFAHQQGYGELITSGRNMKFTASASTPNLSAPPSPALSPPAPVQNMSCTGWIGTWGGGGEEELGDVDSTGESPGVTDDGAGKTPTAEITA